MNRLVFSLLILLLVLPAAHAHLQSDRQSASADANLFAEYSRKWEAMLRRPDFEAQAVSVRSEVEQLLARDRSERTLALAARGYELLADEQAVEKIHDRVLADFPQSDWARDIQARRVFAESDGEKRASLLEAFITRYDGDPRAQLIYSELFRTRAAQPEIPGQRLVTLGDAWVRHAGGSAYVMVTVRVKVAMALAERKVELNHAEDLAREATELAAPLTTESPLVAGESPESRPSVIARLKEDAQVARGFVALRQGRITEAVRELSGPLAPVSKQVERDGYILWQDADLRQYGLRPRALWLAELFEAQGDYEHAARYLLASANDREEDQRAIQSRLLAVYAKLGRREQQAIADLNRAVQRYRDLITPTAATREEEKRRLLASRTATPAPDFKALRFDRKEVSLADFKGKVAVLVFWATWCGPCVAELPHLEAAFKKYAANPDVAFMAISVDEQRLAVRPFVERKAYKLPFAYDVNGAKAFAVGGVPMFVIIDREGRVAFREVGFGGEADRYVERLSWRIDELLKETARTTNE